MFVIATISGKDAADEPTRTYSRRVAITNAERPDVLPKKYEPAFVRANFYFRVNMTSVLTMVTRRKYFPVGSSATSVSLMVTMVSTEVMSARMEYLE